ncbi:Exopolysaccharide synthesis ExoD [Rhodobacter ferrooxidans]|uniref:Exopolysaccharide synthesis ExoD n=2 Tax=Rhodobacter ferrooxidans TaxID=371731 RepID=C8S1A7_9RHOB|nr:Exopolysaccharide synthesis ExoD [Rhodobacter sp. SW2]
MEADPDRRADAVEDLSADLADNDCAPPDHRRSLRKRGDRLSKLLEKIASDDSRDRISVSDLMRALDARAMGALLLVFALPNILPTPPGTSGILGLPLLYLASQLMLDRVPWLPRFIADRTMERQGFAGLVSRAAPWLARAERLLRPRLTYLVWPIMQRGIGALCLVLALALALPIPFGNVLPALAICMLALGLLERDGLWVLLGSVLGVVSLVIVVSVVYGILKTAIFLALNAFG